MTQQRPFPLYLNQNDSELLSYVIVDCAHFDESFYQNIAKSKNIISKSLFIDTPHASSAVAGPLLIHLDHKNNKDFIRQIQKIEEETPAVLWLWNENNFKLTFNQLQRLLFAELENGKKLFFRYYDPRCLQKALIVFKKNEKAKKMLVDINAWAFYKNSQYQYLTLTNLGQAES